MWEFDDTFHPIIRSDLRTGRRFHDRKGRIAAIVQDATLKGLFHSGYRMSIQVEQMLPYLDGKTELSGLPEVLKTELDLSLSVEAVRKVITSLAHYDLLDIPETRQKRTLLETTLQQTLVRPMCDPSGTFYANDPYLLKKAIERCFLMARTDIQNEKRAHASIPPSPASPTAFLLPHGAFHASGRTLAHGLLALLSEPLPDRYIIIGPNHVYPGPPCMTFVPHPFQTPLGLVETDQQAITLLERLCEGHMVSDYISHYRDHSIEIILPFLQWIHDQSPTTPSKPVCIVPLLLTGERHRPGMQEPESHYRIWQSIARGIARFLSFSEQRTIVIVSGDFTHRGPLFHFVPFSGTEEKDFYFWDRPLLQAIEETDAEGFLRAYQATNCCVGRPMYVALKALELYRWFMTDYHAAAQEENAIAFASFVAYCNI